MSIAWPNQVQVGPFVADSDDPVNGWRATQRITGWGAAPVRIDMPDRMQQDGGWDSTPYHSARVVTIEGVVHGSTYAAAKAVSDELRALSLREVHEVVVNNEVLGPRSCMARLEVGADPEWATPLMFRYTLQLRAPDPLLYGAAAFAQTGLSSVSGGAGLPYPLAYPLSYGAEAGVNPGTVIVANEGSASYHPRLRIDGPVTNVVLTVAETGDRVAISGSVAAGQWLDIDCRERRVLLNGQVSLRHRVSSSGSWLGVPPGGGSLTWTADSATSDSALSVWSYQGAWL